MANTNRKWRGAVEPAETSPSGNENKAHRGAVEPVGAVTSGTIPPLQYHHRHHNKAG